MQPRCEVTSGTSSRRKSLPVCRDLHDGSEGSCTDSHDSRSRADHSSATRRCKTRATTASDLKNKHKTIVKSTRHIAKKHAQDYLGSNTFPAKTTKQQKKFDNRRILDWFTDVNREDSTHLVAGLDRRRRCKSVTVFLLASVSVERHRVFGERQVVGGVRTRETGVGRAERRRAVVIRCRADNAGGLCRARG